MNSRTFSRLDEFDFHQRLVTIPDVALVMFTSAHCGSCRAWKRLFCEDPDSIGHALSLFEVDAGQSQGLAREFNVFHLPALFLYRDGRFHCELQAVADRQSLQAAIAAALAALPQEPP